MLSQLRDNTWCFSFWDWLNSLNVTIPSCIHVPANDRTLFSFMGVNSTVDINHVFFSVYSSVLHILAVVSEADVQVSLWHADLRSFGQIPRSGSAGRIYFIFEQTIYWLPEWLNSFSFLTTAFNAAFLVWNFLCLQVTLQTCHAKHSLQFINAERGLCRYMQKFSPIIWMSLNKPQTPEPSNL